MSFKTLSAILRGRWLLDKHWAEAQMPLIVSAIKGDGSFAQIFDKAEEKEENTEPKQVLSHKAGSVYSVHAYSNVANLPEGSIAMMNILGPVTKYGDMCAWGSVDHVATISRLERAANIKGIILNIDSPGGEAAGTAMLADAIKEAGTKKPIIAVIDDGIAASAAMWIASAANEIYVTQKTDQVGSIGVYTTIGDWYGYFEKQGFKVRDIYAPQSTDKNLDYREALVMNDEPVKADLKVLAQEFIDTVKRNRGAKLTGTGWDTGKMFYSREAIRIGLIDGQKTFTQVVRRMDAMIKQKEQSNTNTMAFEKTLVAAKAESFEVVDGGFLLEETHLNNIEEKLKGNEAAAQITADAAIASSNEIISLTDQLNASKQVVTEKDATIAAKDIEIANLKAGAAKPPAATVSTTDDLGASSDAAASETTKEATRLYNMKKGKKTD